MSISSNVAKTGTNSRSQNATVEKCPVIKTDDLKLKESRIILVKAFMNTITKTLDLLGIESPNKI